jgi:hypothetical protein
MATEQFMKYTKAQALKDYGNEVKYFINNSLIGYSEVPAIVMPDLANDRKMIPITEVISYWMTKYLEIAKLPEDADFEQYQY